MILTANESGSNANLNKQFSGAEFASIIVGVGGASKELGDIKKVDKGRTKKGNASGSMNALGINILTANRQRIRDC